MTDLLSQTFRFPDGRALMYAEYGVPDGEPVFYFHGLSGSRLEAGILDGSTLKEMGIRLIACDRPGMGGSDFQSGRTLGQWVSDISTLADSMELGKFAVLGVSGGAGYVFACTALIPERLSAAVVASGLVNMGLQGVLSDFPPVSRMMWKLAARSARLMEIFLNMTRPRNLGDIELIRRQMARSLPQADVLALQKPGCLEAFVASGVESTRQGIRGIAWDTHICAIPWDFQTGKINFPVRLLHAEEDLNVPVAAARKMAAAMPKCQATFYPGEGHFSTVINHFDEVRFALEAGNSGAL